jgi:hypothetical protein
METTTHVGCLFALLAIRNIDLKGEEHLDANSRCDKKISLLVRLWTAILGFAYQRWPTTMPKLIAHIVAHECDHDSELVKSLPTGA